MYADKIEAGMRHFYAKGGRFYTNWHDTVIAAIERGNTVQVSTAVCAAHDEFSETVGQAFALERMIYEEFIVLKKPHFDALIEGLI